MTRRLAARVIVCVLLMEGAAAAQTSAPSTLPSVATPPANVLLANYSGVPVGEIGGLEVGAFLARANDSSSVFYNPAGLTRAEKTSVSGTAGVFQFGGVSAERFDASAHSLQQVPAMFALVLKDVAGRSDLAAGLSVARVSAWHHAVDFDRTAVSGTPRDRLSYSSAATFDSWLASVGVGHASAGKWRTGVSLDAQYTSMERRQAVANQFSTTGSLVALSVASRSEASATHLRFTVGTQYDVTPAVTVGAVLRSRGFGLMSNGLSMFEGVSAQSSATTTASFLDTDVDVTYKIPFEFKTGVAVSSARAQFEFDVSIYDGAGEYHAFTSDRTITVIADTGGPLVTDYPAVLPIIDSRTVVNVAAGGHMNLTSSGSWIVHGGYGTDRSPAGERDTVFTKVHLQKFTAGLSGRTSRFLGSIGVHYETGRSDPILLRELASGQLTTSVGVNSLGLLYSLSVTF